MKKYRLECKILRSNKVKTTWVKGSVNFLNQQDGFGGLLVPNQQDGFGGLLVPNQLVLSSYVVHLVSACKTCAAFSLDSGLARTE